MLCLMAEKGEFKEIKDPCILGQPLDELRKVTLNDVATTYMQRDMCFKLT